MPAPTVGAQLQAARTARGWSVQEVATRLRIRPALVEALEQGDYAPFLAAAYARGQLRNYARLMGLDAEALLAQFAAPAPSAASRTLHRAPELHPRRPWLVRIGGFIVVGALVVLGALWAQSNRAPQVPAEPVAPVAESAPPPAAEAPESVGQTPPSLPAIAGDTPAPPAPPSPVEPALATVDASRPEPAAPSTASTAPPVSEATTAAPAGSELRLRSRAVSWVEVTDHRGQRLIYELVGPDQERVVSGAPPLRVLLGNAPAIDLMYGGQAVALPPGQHVVRMTLGAAAPDAVGAVAAPAATPPPAH
jgi:cytoskeleton protein RodZ